MSEIKKRKFTLGDIIIIGIVLIIGITLLAPPNA